MKPRKTRLRAEAADRECTVRGPGCVTGPCCLAHVRIVGITGMGMKAPDFLGAWSCDTCHKRYDTRGRLSCFEADEIEALFLRGVLRTQYQLWQEGKIQEAA